MSFKLRKSLSGPGRVKGLPSKSQGQRLSEYALGETIGEGTFGKVKKSTHKKTGAQVAIKIIDKARIVKPADRHRVLKEIKILRRLDHPHIIQLYEVLNSRKYIFLIMDYVPRGELFDYIVEHGRLLEWQACRFFHQLTDAVDYMHSRNIVHRDLKPENLLLDEKLRLKICDFGLGNINKDDFIFKTACGSPCYVAPEMISGGSYDGAGVDIWACGVILYAMICGYLPFEDTGNLTALYDLIFSAKYEVPGFVSKDAESLITRILVANTSKRYTIKQIRKHRWFRMLPETKRKQQPSPSEPEVAELVLEEIMGFYNENTPLGSPRRKQPSSVRNGLPSQADLPQDSFSCSPQCVRNDPRSSKSKTPERRQNPSGDGRFDWRALNNLKIDTEPETVSSAEMKKDAQAMAKKEFDLSEIAKALPTTKPTHKPSVSSPIVPSSVDVSKLKAPRDEKH